MKNRVSTILILMLAVACLSGCSSGEKQFVGFVPEYKGEWSEPSTRTPTNKVPDGAICGNGDIGVVLGGKPEKQILYFSKNDFWKAQNGYPDGGVCYVGQLHIASEQLVGASYHVEQTLADAVIRGVYTQKDGSQLKMNVWCAATENVAIIELEASGKPVKLNLDFELAEGMGSQNEAGQEQDVNWFVRSFTGESLEWSSQVAVALNSTTKQLSGCNLNAGEKMTLKLAFSTNHDTSEYKAKAIGMAKDLTASVLVSLAESHRKWWSDFWNASHVELHDPYLEQYYYASLYLLACCSRNENFPPGLWGTSLTMDATANGWAGDYHTNYNHMAPWWGTYSSNHVELSEPYDAPILAYMPKAQEHAREFLNKKGVYYPVGIGPKGFCSSMFPLTKDAMMKQYGTPEYDLEGGYMFLGQKSNAVFCTTNMFMRFYHTYDKAYVERVYPFIRAVADFWEDYLVYENGRYVSYDDNFWEVGPWEGKDFKKNYGDINPTVSLGLCRMLFKGIIDMSQYLQTDQDKVEKWNHILRNLSAIPTVEQNGVTRILACEGGNGSGSRTTPGFGRVMMHGLVFPSGMCGVLTDSVFAKVLRDEMYRWEVDTIPFAGWQDARWDNLTGGIETYFTSAARVGYNGNRLLEKLKERINKTAYPNLWIPQAGGGVESLSAVPSCINEMLLQGYEGVIRVFPVWPKEKDASFTNLRTHGAFLVSASRKNGMIGEVTIISEKGRPCKIENPWGAEPCVVYRENGDKKRYSDHYFELETAVSEKIRIEKE